VIRLRCYESAVQTFRTGPLINLHRVYGTAMRKWVYTEAPEASTLLGRTGKLWGCRSSTTPSRVSLEGRNRLFSKGYGSIIAHG
jgi:hypothetical protein